MTATCQRRLLHKGESLCCFRDSASVTYGGMLPSDLTLSALRFILSAKSGQSCKQDCETVDFCNSLKRSQSLPEPSHPQRYKTLCEATTPRMRLLHKGESLCCFRDSASVTYGGMLPSDLTLSALRFILSAKSRQSCKQDCETVDFCNSLRMPCSV